MARQDKIRIKVVVPADQSPQRSGRAGKVLLRLARLIGRQMAREASARKRRYPEEIGVEHVEAGQD